MSSVYSIPQIVEILARAERSLLIISERIRDNFLYLYNPEYGYFKDLQYDIYTLFKTIGQEINYTPYDSDFYPLVNVLISKCEMVDAYNSQYNTINPNYSNINDNIITITIITDFNTNYGEPVILNKNSFEIDGITYLNNNWVGLNNFLIFYNEGGRYLTPNVDYIVLSSGGIELTGFGQIYDGMSFYVTF